jgi:hypothetical protein
MTRGQWIWLAGLIAAVGLTIWSVVWWRPWDSRLSADQAARALRAKLHTRWTFTCKRQENDGTISMKDVDYLCEPSEPAEFGYWIGTNARRITEIQPTG